MGNIFNDDFRDFIAQLNANAVKYILIGGYSVILHGYSRTTGDMDILVEKSENNYGNLVDAFRAFGMPVFDMTKENFLKNDAFDVFTYGRPPSSIDIMTSAKGLNFDETFSNSSVHIEDGLKIRLIHVNDLKIAKRASNRAKDIDDLENLNS